jgi:hypothetical protein
MARARNESAQTKNDDSKIQKPDMDNPFARSAKARREAEIVVLAPKGKTMSLSQMSHMAPKKFKSQRKKPQINLSEVRKLIDESKK